MAYARGYTRMVDNAVPAENLTRGHRPSMYGILHLGNVCYWRLRSAGATGISSDREWAQSDVERHRRNGNHEVAE